MAIQRHEQAPRRAPGETSQISFRSRQLRQDPIRGRQEPSPRRGKAHRATLAFEKRRAEALLQEP